MIHIITSIICRSYKCLSTYELPTNIDSSKMNKDHVLLKSRSRAIFETNMEDKIVLLKSKSKFNIG